MLPVYQCAFIIVDRGGSTDTVDILALHCVCSHFFLL